MRNLLSFYNVKNTCKNKLNCKQRTCVRPTSLNLMPEYGGPGRGTAFTATQAQSLTLLIIGSKSPGILPCIDYTGMWRCTGYGVQNFLSRTRDSKQAFLVRNRESNLSEFRIKCLVKAQFRNRRYFVKTQRPKQKLFCQNTTANVYKAYSQYKFATNSVKNRAQATLSTKHTCT